MHNCETYTNYERTFLNSNGTPWQGSSTSSSLVVTGLGTSSLALQGVNGNEGPFGYGDWTTTASVVDLGYGIVFGGPPQFPNAQANGVEIAVVPEPGGIGYALFSLVAAAVCRRRHLLAQDQLPLSLHRTGPHSGGPGFIVSPAVPAAYPCRSAK